MRVPITGDPANHGFGNRAAEALAMAREEQGIGCRVPELQLLLIYPGPQFNSATQAVTLDAIAEFSLEPALANQRDPNP